ncbi:MAG: response regulator [Elusimicrobiota bacterium]
MGQRLRVLILDDEPIVCDRLKGSLEKAGFEVETFTESERVVKRLEEARFDFVVTDLKMKGWDGIEILKLVKTRSPETKVILITGFATVEKAKEALKIGAHDFIAKPFKLSQLRDLILNASRGADPAGREPEGES